MTRAALTIEVERLGDPCVWTWTIRAGTAIVENSWDSWWVGYDSRREAETAGRQRLALLGSAADT